MPVFSALPWLALAALAQDPKPEEVPPDAAKVVDRRVVVRKAAEELARPGVSIQVQARPTSAAPTAYAPQGLLLDANQAEVAWQSAFQDWQHVTLSLGAGIEGVGAQLSPVDDAVRAQLKLPEGRGLVVTNVADGGPASRAGLKANDILLTLGDAPLQRPENLLGVLLRGVSACPNCGANVLEAAKGHAKVSLTLLRDGQPAAIDVRPEVRVALGVAVAPKADYFIGTPANPVDETLRAHLGLPEGHGLVVSDAPEAGSPAAKAGIQKSDILLSFDGAILKDVEALRAKIQAVGPKPATVEVIRAGKRITASVTPEPRKADPASADATSQMIRMMGGGGGGVPILDGLPYVRRLYTVDQLQGQPSAVLTPTEYAAPDLTRKLDDLSAQVQALTKAVEELRKTAKPTGEGK